MAHTASPEAPAATGLPLRTLIACGVAYLAVSLAAYATVLPTFFVSDDFSYLDAIRQARSPAVLFSALAGRYFRPLVVAVYYVNYTAAGLTAWPYHLSVVVVHALASWCVCMLGRRLWPQSVAKPFLAGLLFACFGGHSEAVSWVGGMADPLVTLLVLTALLAHLRALRSTHERWWVAASWVAFGLALLAKESAVIYPVLLVLCLAVLEPQALRRNPRRVVSWLIVPALLIGALLVARHQALGFFSVRLSGLGTNTHPIAMTRAFVLRTVLPAGEPALTIFRHRLDVFVLLPLVIGAFVLGRAPQRRALAFALAGMFLALAPVLPLSISLLTTESERLAYMASAFASLFVVAWLDVVLRRERAVAGAVAVLCVLHVAALQRSNGNWIEASRIVEGTLQTFGQIVRAHGGIGIPIVVVNVPDDIRGAYIYRRGFHDALRVTLQDLSGLMADTRVLSVYAIGAAPVDARTSIVGRRQLAISTGGSLLGVPAADTPDVALSDWSGGSFAARFGVPSDGSLVVYFSPWKTVFVGRLPFAIEPTR